MRGVLVLLIFHSWPRRLARLMLAGATLALAALLVIPAIAAASTATSAPTLVLPWQQVWPILIGAATPLVTYALNHVGPWLTEPVKAAVLVVASAIANGVYTALATSVFGFNAATLQLLLTGIAASLAAHHMLWRPAGIAGALGGGTNRQASVGGGAVRPTSAAQPPPAQGPIPPDAPHA